MLGLNTLKKKQRNKKTKRLIIFVPQILKEERLKMKKLKKYTALLLLILAIFATSCKDSPLPDPNDQKPLAPKVTRDINRFIKNAMNELYLWYQHMPDIDTRYELDSKEYFDKLLYEEDKWSFITDDAKALENSLKGVETSFGYSLAFGRFSNTGNIYAVVEYVYPNTPAAQAGIKRGDIIVYLNGKDITDKTYTDLLYAPNVSLTFGIAGENGISLSPQTVQMTAKELNLDPVLITDIIEHGGKKIGYLFYAQYIGNYNTRLDDAFGFFMDEGITDLVVDLRYNPGGGVDAARHFCSAIAPVNVVNEEKVLITFQWNDKLQRELERLNNVENLRILFKRSVPTKLGLNKVYFLTGRGTASASELSITGLKPYMNVVTIGGTTYGKYTASNTFKPKDFYDNPEDYKDFANWAIQPIIARFANSVGVTDFKDGFAPDIPVVDDLVSGIPLGHKEEPLLKAAIEEITGTQVVAMKKALKPIPGFEIFDRGFSRFDVNKRELLLNEIDIDILMQ